MLSVFGGNFSRTGNGLLLHPRDHVSAYSNDIDISHVFDQKAVLRRGSLLLLFLGLTKVYLDSVASRSFYFRNKRAKYTYAHTTPTHTHAHINVIILNFFKRLMHN